MKVLMFGWEFPPHISGGLGTACYGLTKGLAKNEVEILFVMPHASGDEDKTAVRILNASDIEIFANVKELEEFWEHVNFFEIGSNLIPYLGPEEFEALVNYNIKGTQDKNQIVGFGQKYKFS